MTSPMILDILGLRLITTSINFAEEVSVTNLSSRWPLDQNITSLRDHVQHIYNHLIFLHLVQFLGYSENLNAKVQEITMTLTFYPFIILDY